MIKVYINSFIIGTLWFCVLVNYWWVAMASCTCSTCAGVSSRLAAFRKLPQSLMKTLISVWHLAALCQHIRLWRERLNILKNAEGSKTIVFPSAGRSKRIKKASAAIFFMWLSTPWQNNGRAHWPCPNTACVCINIPRSFSGVKRPSEYVSVGQLI